jgi:pimeloyl-ACP methyl ester carboxylesterase
MPKVEVNRIGIHFEEHGSGPPLVMIGGLGADTHLWSKQVPAFSKRFRVVVFDNRGSGESDKPDEPYSIPMFVADTVGLMKALGIDKAHVVGASLGGLIAQELVLTHPEMVDRLVLMCTTSNGPRSVRPSLWSLIPMAFRLRRTGDPAADTRRAFSVFAHPRWLKDNPDEVDEYVAWRVAHPQPRYAFKRQRGAIKGFHREDRLGTITAPTLIVHGDSDRIAPAANARVLGELIPNAEVVILEESGHACSFDQRDRVNEAVLRFLTAPGEGTGR